KLDPEPLAEQAALLESYGADVVYVVDSAGAMVPRMAGDRVAAVRSAISADIGFHAHNNLGVGIANALTAAEQGARYIGGPRARPAGDGVAAVRSAIPADAGSRAPSNPGAGIATAVAAGEQGARYLDGSLRGLGASAGNAQTEVLAAAFERAGWDTGVDLFPLI